MTRENIRRHPSIRGTLPLPKPTMSSNPPRGRQLPRPRTRVHGDGLADDKAIGNEFADRLARVCVGDFVDFVGVEPYFAFAAADHGGREALLSAEVYPVEEEGTG